MKSTVSLSLVGHRMQSELATGCSEKEQIKQHSRAIALAESIFKPDTYWHSRRVADKVDGIMTATVAWLHDIVEDTDVDLDRLKRMGFADDIREAVDLLTRPSYREYASYIRDIALAGYSSSVRSLWRVGEFALQVKLADLEDHLEQTETLRPSLEKRYRKAQAVLSYGNLDAFKEWKFFAEFWNTWEYEE